MKNDEITEPGMYRVTEKGTTCNFEQSIEYCEDCGELVARGPVTIALYRMRKELDFEKIGDAK